MVRITQGHNTAAMFFSARDTKLHGLVANHLTKARLPVQAHHRAPIHLRHDMYIGL